MERAYVWRRLWVARPRSYVLRERRAYCSVSAPEADLSRREVRKAVTDSLAQELGVSSPEQWRRVTNKDFIAVGGSRLLGRFGNSLHRLLEDVYGYGLECRSKAPRGYWLEPSNRVAFVKRLQEKYAITAPEQWRTLTAEMVHQEGGRRLLNLYNGSIHNMLKDTLPENSFSSSMRPKKQRNFWKDPDHCKRFLEGISRKLDIREPQDWLRVPVKTIQSMGGYGLFRTYRNLSDALQLLYPEVPREELLQYRPVVSADHWEDRERVLKFMDEMKETFGLEKREDWYRLSYKHFAIMRGSGLLKRMKLIDLLRYCYPEEDWSEEEATKSAKRASQHLLLFQLRKLLGGTVEIIEEYRCLDMLDTRGRVGLELDFYVPTLKLALEYNGIHHYEEVSFFGSAEEYRVRDERKKGLCGERGIRLVYVPYWWDHQLESLAATLHSTYPGVLEELTATRE